MDNFWAQRLCHYDKRHPDWEAIHDPEEDEDSQSLDKDCCCDNCFYGRTAATLRHLAEVDELKAVLLSGSVKLSSYNGPDSLKNATRASWSLQLGPVEFDGNEQPTIEEWVAQACASV